MARAVDAQGRLECKQCGEMKWPQEFSVHATNRVGRMIYCKPCIWVRKKEKRLLSGEAYKDRRHSFNKRYPDDAELISFLRDRWPEAAGLLDELEGRVEI